MLDEGDGCISDFTPFPLHPPLSYRPTYLHVYATSSKRPYPSTLYVCLVHEMDYLVHTYRTKNKRSKDNGVREWLQGKSTSTVVVRCSTVNKVE